MFPLRRPRNSTAPTQADRGTQEGSSSFFPATDTKKGRRSVLFLFFPKPQGRIAPSLTGLAFSALLSQQSGLRWEEAHRRGFSRIPATVRQALRGHVRCRLRRASAAARDGFFLPPLSLDPAQGPQHQHAAHGHETGQDIVQHDAPAGG